MSTWNLNASAPASIDQIFAEGAPVSNWQINDSAPASIAQGFDAVPAEQTEKYWGGPMSIEMSAQAGVVQSGQASSVCTASVLVNAKRVVSGISPATGTGVTQAIAKRVTSGSSSIVGTGIVQATGTRVLKVILSASGIAVSQAISEKILPGSLAASATAIAIATASRRVGASASSSATATSSASAARRISGSASSSAASTSSASPSRISMAISVSMGEVYCGGDSYLVACGGIDVQVGLMAFAVPAMASDEQPTVHTQPVHSVAHTSFVGVNFSSKSHAAKGKATMSSLRSDGKGSRVASSEFDVVMNPLSVWIDGNVSSQIERAWPKDDTKAREWVFSQQDEREALQVLAGLFDD